MVHTFKDNSIDILHIDIANNGDVYKFTIEYYLKKVSNGGLLILEGGSKERDQVEWMKKYSKPSIKKYLDTLKDLQVLTIGAVPSITVIKK